MKLHHIGYLVKDIQRSARAFQALGFQGVSLCGQEPIVLDPFRQCNILFMDDCTGGGVIELISPVSDASPIYGLLGKYKNTPYHLCFETEALSAELCRLKASGWLMFQEAAPAPAIGGRDVVFLMHRNAGIIELVCKD